MKLPGTAFLAFFFLFNILEAQTGPGGVGSSGSNAIWYSADFGTFINAGTTPAAHAQQVQQWNDRSGNNRHATQATAANRPTLRTNNANGYPGLRFTGDMYLDGPTPGIANNSSYTYLLVFRDTTTGLGATNDGTGHFILDRPSATDALVSLKPVTGSFYFYQKRNDASGGLGGVTNTTPINTTSKVLELRRSYNVNYQLFYNNTQQGGSLADADGLTTPPPPRIGRHATTANGGIRGYFYEFIVYSTALNAAQTTIVNNYLAAKYAITLGSLDLYTMDNAGNGDYDHEVAGIGRVDAANSHDDSKGPGIVRIYSPSGLGNNEYLFWGHNNASLNANEITDVPAGVQARMNRVWRVSEVTNTGAAADVGNVDMMFDLTGLGTVTTADLRLLVDTDNDGTFADETPISGAVFMGGNAYQFNAVSALANTRRFTLGTANKVQTPLPVELISFRAIAKDRQSVELSWQTASEKNNAFFTVERSPDAEHWEEILRLDGAGNSSHLLNYSAIDESALSGLSYYRLKQTDRDDDFKYSPIVSVNLGIEPEKALKIYPNPSTSIINITASALELSEISIRNTMGQELSTRIRIERPQQTSAVLDLSELSAGIYYVKTLTQSGMIRKN